MAQDFAALASTTNYLTLLSQISDRDIALAKGLDPATTTPTNLPANSLRWSSSNKRWELFDGTSWSELIASATDAYNITVTGHRGGNFYGSIALGSGATISGAGTIDVVTLKGSGSVVWTVATLTNLNQLTNGPGFITASALSPYAPLAGASFTGDVSSTTKIGAPKIGAGTTAPSYSLDVNGPQVSNIVAMAALDIDCSLGSYFTKSINANSTFTFSNAPTTRAFAFTLELTHNSGTVTWPAAVVWPNGVAPSLTTGKTHLFVFTTNNGGTRWRGASQVNYTT